MLVRSILTGVNYIQSNILAYQTKVNMKRQYLQAILAMPRERVREVFSAQADLMLSIQQVINILSFHPFRLSSHRDI